MKQTRSEYITTQHKECENEGLKYNEYINFNFDDEYYSMLSDHIKKGNTITQEVYNDLTPGQQYHFNKHYNYRGDKIINSDYEKEIEEGKKQTEKEFNKYLLEQEQEQEIIKQKEKQNIVRELTEEIKQLQSILPIDYNKLSLIGKRNNDKNNYELKQIKIKEKIAELEQKIDMIS